MIQFGNDKIKEIYVGSDKIKEVYHGSDLVWSGKKTSYAILTDGTRVNFELENTPMSNFQNDDIFITMNGQEYDKFDIKEITFGVSYENVISIGDFFLNNCYPLSSVDLSGFVNVTSIGDFFLKSCPSLPSVDLSGFVNVTSIGFALMVFCEALNTLYIGTTVPPTLGGQLFYNTPIQNIKVPAQSVDAYKTAEGWSDFASIISGY